MLIWHWFYLLVRNNLEIRRSYNITIMKIRSTKNYRTELKRVGRYLFCLMGLLVLDQFHAFAQPQFSVGSTTSGANSIPFGTGTWADDRCQMLYLPSDFSSVPAGMAISTIYFVPTSSGAVTFTDLVIDIGQDNITSLTSSSWVAGLTNAFTRASYSTTRTQNQWWAITLDNPIPYDPTQPLIVDVRKVNSTSSVALRNQSGSGNRRAYSSSSTSSSPTGASSTRYSFGFDLIALAPDNAGITKLLSPKYKCAGNHDIKVELSNTGTNPLTNVTIDWELDGVPQPTINWTGNLASRATETITLATGQAFGATARNVMAWTSNPNNMVDTVNQDDTLNVDARASLSGVYTVGATGSDFTSVREAVDTMLAYGICGPITIDIAAGTYNDQINIKSIPGSSNVNRVTFKSQSGIPSSVNLTFSPTGNDYVLQLSGASYITLKDLTIQSNSSNAGRVVIFSGNSSYDSLINCTLNASSTATSSNTSGIYATSFAGKKNVFLNNRINRGYYGIYWRGSGSSSLTEDHVFEGNTISDIYYYSSYFYYNDNLKYRNNTITTNAPTTHYGIYAYYCDNELEIVGNRVTINGNTSGTQYGIRMYYDDATSSKRGLVANNAILINNNSSSAYGMYIRYTKYQDFYNNTVNVNTTSSTSYASYFYYSSSTYKDNTIRNNVFANTSNGTNGTSMYVYRTGYGNSWDYNNLYSTGTDLVEEGSASTSYQDIRSWRAGSDEDLHSISYDPGFVSNTNNVQPDINNPASWSLNGRAVQTKVITTDIIGNNRFTDRANGVSDIGAFEFEPNVAPPLATPVPTSGTPGTSQDYEFGGNVVATINWGTALRLTTPLEIRQYSGRKGPGFSEPEFMYFYTDVQNTAPGSSFDFDVEVNYMDIWLGTISSEPAVKLAHKYNNSAWIAYNGALSQTDDTKNIIEATGLTNFGQYTGIMDGVKHSVVVKLSGGSIICTGDSVKLSAVTGMPGTFTYQWRRNGQDLTGANNADLMVDQAGDYSVVVVDVNANKQIESIPVSINIIAPPNALVNANGPLTYCTGGTLQLSTAQQPSYLYQWQLNGQDLNGETSPTLGVSSAGTYTVRVANVACEVTSQTQVVTAGPLVVNLGNDISRCEIKGQPVELNAGYTGAKFNWSNGDTTQKVQVNQSGTYWVQVDAGPNCLDVDTIEVTLDPLPSAKGISYVRNGGQFTFSPSGEKDVDSYMWIFGDGTQSFQRTVSKSVNGDLYVRLIMFNACGTDTLQIGWPLNTAHLAKEGAVKVYPNPATDHVVFDNLGDNISHIVLTDMMGKTIQRIDVSGVATVKWYTSDIANGVYFYTVFDGDTALEKGKVVVRR